MTEPRTLAEQELAKTWLIGWLKIQQPKPKPTIAELEAILAEETTGEINVLPDGHVCVEPPEWVVSALAEFAKSQSSWIKITDDPKSLPEIQEGMRVSRRVLTWDGIQEHIGWLSEETEEWWEQENETTKKKRTRTDRHWAFEADDYYFVTHWREIGELPPPPESGQ